MIHPEDQLKDEGAVLGYRPDLTITPNKQRQEAEPTETISSALDAFCWCDPNSYFPEVQTMIDDNLMQAARWLTQKQNEQLPCIAKFQSYVNDLMTLYQTFIKETNLLFYGTEEEGKTTVSKLKEYESSGMSQKINYLAVSEDSVLGYGLNQFLYQLNQTALDLMDVLEDTVTDNPFIPNAYLFESLLQKNKEQQKQLQAEKQRQTASLHQVFYHYASSIKEQCDMYDSVLATGGEESPYLCYLEEYKERTMLAMNNVFRYLLFEIRIKQKELLALKEEVRLQQALLPQLEK